MDMTREKISEIKKWFAAYTAAFYCGDDFVDTNVRLKTLHTAKVAEEITNLADDINLEQQQKNIATIIGLLHDCGRFEQIRKYRTFNDGESENHAILAIKIMEEQKIIDDLPADVQLMIKEAIKWHNAKTIELPADVPHDTLLYAKMIRDADKLDIFRVVKVSYEQYLKDPSKANNMAMNFGQDTGKCSQAVMDDLLAHKQVEYTKLQTLDDRKLLQLCWVFDINFPPILQKLIDRGYIRMIFDALPQTQQMETAKQTVCKYVDTILPDYSKNI